MPLAVEFFLVAGVYSNGAADGTRRIVRRVAGFVGYVPCVQRYPWPALVSFSVMSVSTAC